MLGFQWGLIAGALALAALPAAAQVGSDVPRDHWAYAAIQDLAQRGLLKGYPPGGDVFGGRAVTRYEMAALISRVLAELDARKADAPPPGVQPAQIEEIKRLVAEFQPQLLVLGADLKKAQQQLEELQAALVGVKRTADKAAADAATASKDTAALKDALKKTDQTVAGLAKELRAHKVGGYFQARFESLDRGGSALFPIGGGTGPTPTNGAPAVGGAQYGFLLRRVRLKVSGPIASRSDYTVQLDAQSVGSVSLIDAFVNVANLPFKGVTGRFGQFTPPFGQELFVPSSVRESPERSFAFGVNAADYPMFKTSFSSTGGTITPGSVLPLFLSQNRDVGAVFVWSSPGAPATQKRISLGVIDGEGRAATGARNNNGGLDLIGRAEAGLAGGKLTLGASGYYGSLAVRGGAPVNGAPVAFVNAQRRLYGADVRYTLPWSTLLRAEYLEGLFETTPDREQYLARNHARAWYVSARQPIGKRLDVIAKYNEYSPITSGTVTVGGLSGSQLTRKSVGVGLLYPLDEATRFRLWYDKSLVPYDPSATAGPLRSKLGLITLELQTSY